MRHLYSDLCPLVCQVTPEQLEKIAGSDNAIAMVCHLFSYAAGAKATAIAAMVSCWASALTFYSIMPRFFYDLGRRGILPGWFAVLNKKQIPQNGVVAYGISALFACLYSSYAYVDGLFDGINDFFTMQAISSCIAYILICISNIKEEAHNKRFFKGMIMGKVIPCIAICALVYLMSSSGIRYVVFTGFWMILGWFFMRSRAHLWGTENSNF